TAPHRRRAVKKAVGEYVSRPFRVAAHHEWPGRAPTNGQARANHADESTSSGNPRGTAGLEKGMRTVRGVPRRYLAGLPTPARALVMGVLNVTPDSFSDGGLWARTDAAVAHGLQLREQGADVVDV